MSQLNIIDINPSNTNKFSKVFSSNIFIPMELNLSSKTFTYASGLIKLVETFKRQTEWSDVNMETNWGLYIFVDATFLDNNFDNKIYESSSENNMLNKNIKNSYSNNKEIILKLHKLYYEYINHIIKNPKKYEHVKLYSFMDMGIKKKYIKKFKFHPQTYGSFMRFLPMFDDYINSEISGMSKENNGEIYYNALNNNIKSPPISFEHVRIYVCINITYVITKNQMKLINDWIYSKKKLLTLHLGYSFRNDIFYQYINDLLLDVDDKKLSKNNDDSKFRIPANICGYNKDGILDTSLWSSKFFKTINNTHNSDGITYHRFKTMIDKLINSYNIDQTYDIFQYMIDEIILKILFYRYFYPKTNNIYFFYSMDNYEGDIKYKILSIVKNKLVKDSKKEDEKYIQELSKIFQTHHQYLSMKFIYNKLEPSSKKEFLKFFSKPVDTIIRRSLGLKHLYNHAFIGLVQSFEEYMPLLLYSSSYNNIMSKYIDYFHTFDINQYDESNINELMNNMISITENDNYLIDIQSGGTKKINNKKNISKKINKIYNNKKTINKSDKRKKSKNNKKRNNKKGNSKKGNIKKGNSKK